MWVYSNRFPNCSGHHIHIHIYIYTLKTHVLLYIILRYTVYIYSISIYIHIPWNITTYPKSPVHFWSPAVRHPLGTRQLRSVGPSCGEPSQAPGPSSSGARVGEERVSSYQRAWFMIISSLNKLVNIYIYMYIYNRFLLSHWIYLSISMYISLSIYLEMHVYIYIYIIYFYEDNP